MPPAAQSADFHGTVSPKGVSFSPVAAKIVQRSVWEKAAYLFPSVSLEGFLSKTRRLTVSCQPACFDLLCQNRDLRFAARMFLRCLPSALFLLFYRSLFEVVVFGQLLIAAWMQQQYLVAKAAQEQSSPVVSLHSNHKRKKWKYRPHSSGFVIKE